MRLRGYKDSTIEVLRQTENPQEVVAKGLQQCMKQDVTATTLTIPQIKYLLTAGHTSPLEHVSMTIHVKGVSRSLLAQVTRQRTFKFTSSSQHYQDYRDYAAIVLDKYKDDSLLSAILDNAMDGYKILVGHGVPIEEARQVLPGAAAVNLLVTADARNLTNFFIQRRCERNVAEMVHFADSWWHLAKRWFPELFSQVGAPCFMTGECTQGKMRAQKCRLTEVF